MSEQQYKTEKTPRISFVNEYVVITDKTSKVVLSSTDWNECVKQANFVRACGGEVTIFKATKG